MHSVYWAQHSVKPPDVLWAALYFAHSTPTQGSLKAPSVRRRTLVQQHLPISDDAFFFLSDSIDPPKLLI